MKKIGLLFLLCVFCLGLAGCGGKKAANDNSTNQNNNSNEKEEETKTTTIASSYEKFSELKTAAYDKLSDEMEKSDNDNFSLSMSLLGFATVDLSLIPLTFCGLDQNAALIGLSVFYANAEYENTDNSCKITFATDAGKMTYDTLYDEKSDSLQTKMYENDKLIAISEYIKLEDGYATQFYSSDNNDKKSVYKSIFSENKIVVGMKSEVSEPESIFKNKNIISEDWTKSEELWSKYENGTVASIYEGKEY